MSATNGTNPAPAREGRVSLAEAAKTGRRRANAGSVGFPGLNRYKGLINEEYVSQLSGSRAIDVYTRMRSDGLVEALLAALRLPVMAASWVVEPAGKDRNAKRAAELVEENLFERLGACWEDEIREALNYLWFGFHCAAKNWTVERGAVWLSELRPLHPKTILQGGKNWIFDDAGHVIGVWQSGWDGERYREEEIPGEALLLFTHDGSYGNPQGRSVLRASYKHWLIVDTLYRIQAIGLERSAIGTPMGKYPAGATDEVKDEIEAFLKYVQAQENGYGLFEVGTEVENFSLDIKTGDISAAINHHGTRMAQSVLAQFLHLGQDGSKGGAYALSADQSDLFMLSLSSIADYVAARFNRDVIPELVGYNLATDQYPRLSATISRRTASALAQLIRPLTAGQNAPVTWGAADEDWLREQLELPARTEERAPKALPQGRTPGQPQQPGAPQDGEPEQPQQQSRPRIELKGWTSQPRVPAGSPAGGQWTNGPSGAGGGGGAAVDEPSASAIDPAEIRENASQWVQDTAKDWESQLTDEERQAVREYTGAKYKQINEGLRAGKSPADVKFATEIDAAIEKSTLDRDIVVQRGFRIGALNNMFDGGEIVGAVIDHSGFTSTSREKPLGGGVGIQATIIVPKGAKAAPVERISRNRKEKEVLLPRNTRLRVREAFEDEFGVRQIVAEVIL